MLLGNSCGEALAEAVPADVPVVALAVSPELHAANAANAARTDFAPRSSRGPRVEP